MTELLAEIEKLDGKTKTKLNFFHNMLQMNVALDTSVLITYKMSLISFILFSVIRL